MIAKEIRTARDDRERVNKTSCQQIIYRIRFNFYSTGEESQEYGEPQPLIQKTPVPNQGRRLWPGWWRKT